MGYRSSWKIAARGPHGYIEKFIEWIEEQGQSHPRVSYRPVFELIHRNLQYKGDGMVEYGHEYTKCYTPWSFVVDHIIDHGRDELNLAVAYGRMGEGLDDLEFNHDEDHDLYVDYYRGLENVFMREEGNGQSSNDEGAG